jgi:hypothetical protein
MIEDRAQTQARSTNPIRQHEGTAWESIVTDSNILTGGSKMRNFSRPKRRIIVEISFDPESQAQFPQLSPKNTNRQNQNIRKTKSADESPTSSHSDSVSAVTRAKFENLSQEIGQMIKNEVQSTLSTSTDQTMMTMFRDEMAANRIESQKQMELIQIQLLTSFQNLINGLMSHLTSSLANSPTSTNASTPTHNPNINQTPVPNPDKTTDDQPSDTPTTQPEETTHQAPNNQAEPASPPRIKKVSIADEQMPATVSHSAPSASGDTPPPKRRNAGLNIQHMTPLIAQTRTKSANRIFPPSNPKSTTVSKKANGGVL